MANPISRQLAIGTIGELLVQLRLLQYDVQAAPPLEDSGNDLVALRGFAIRCIQVKTTSGVIPAWPVDTNRYHLLAIVRLAGEGRELRLDQSQIFLLQKTELANTNRSWNSFREFELSAARVEALFHEVGAA